MSEDSLLIHIGLHKTGTTWLQRRVFSDPAMGYLSTPNGQSNEATDAFVTVDPLAFDADSALARFTPMLSEARQRGLVPVISQERLSSDPSFGGYYFTDVLDRLIETFGAFRLLLTIREQKGMLLALYRQAVRSGATFSLRQAIGTGDEPTGWKPTIRPEYLLYDRMIEHVRSRLGDDRVCVLPLELMRRDPERYMRELQAFSGAKSSVVPSMEAENAGYSPLATRVSTVVNRFAWPNPLGPEQPMSVRLARRGMWWFDRVVPMSLSQGVSRRWREQIAGRVGTMYQDSNRRTAAMIGYPLGEWGYDVG
ncbi:MAG TPA: sulfotransferase family protein [Phycisphaerales bacterium]|nr:sulfotransferase family protein [Phycisphaerales bacterium]